ncbi:hypothetical protein, partial [Falsiroseomonas oryziterrae]|uniref:hypothetical protein n=1 Tax=Falsiroseomonas oryziterrae TaxID=2911368 RepID=UPI001F1C3363
MSTLEWVVQGLLLAMLAVFIPMAWRLERRVAALRAAGGGLQDGAKGLSDATAAAEAALARLRA